MLRPDLLGLAGCERPFKQTVRPKGRYHLCLCSGHKVGSSACLLFATWSFYREYRSLEALNTFEVSMSKVWNVFLPSSVRSFEQTLTPLDGVLFLLQSCEKRIRLCTFSGSHRTTVNAGLTLQVDTIVTPWEHVFRIKTEWVCLST